MLVCRQIRNYQSVKGIIFKDKEIKLALFEHDMPCFLRDIRSYRQLCVILHLFSKYSGLRVNNDKTEFFAVSPHRLQEASFSHKICTSIKILGFVFDYRIPSRTKADCDFIFKSIQEMLNMWNWRELTLLGKLEIVKFLIIPKCLSKVALISVTDDLVQEINKLIYLFGRAQVKSNAVHLLIILRMVG